MGGQVPWYKEGCSMSPRSISCSPASTSGHLDSPSSSRWVPGLPILSLSHFSATTSQVKEAAPLVGSPQYFLPWATKITGARKSCSDWGPGAGPSPALPKSSSSQFHSLNLLFDLRGWHELRGYLGSMSSLVLSTHQPVSKILDLYPWDTVNC